MKFDIDKESRKLKELVSKYDSNSFVGDISQLLTLIEPPRMPIYPFQGLDSPFRQLTYLISLNISSNNNLVTKQSVESDEEWKEIVEQIIRVRAGYYDELLPAENEDDEQFAKVYQVSMPVFNNYFDTGNLNFEEQEIEKIESIFKPFNDIVLNESGLNIDDFVKIYNLIDNELETTLNIPLTITRKSKEADVFWEKQKLNKINPLDWEYNGDNEEIKILVKYFSDRSFKFTIKKSELIKKFDNDKIEKFLRLFASSRTEDESYLYYTQPNKILLKPIYQKSDDEYIVIDTKQIIHSVYRKLHDILVNSNKRESYFTFRGNWLQNKTESILRGYFGDSANIYNEFKVNGNAQDILLLNKGLALIIENKAHKEVQFSGVPDTINIYKQYFSRFKKSIRDGYLQSWRIKDLFYYEDDFIITDLKNKPLQEIKTNKFHSVFSIIVTLDKFREPQINTSQLLELNEDDDYYPLSMSIDDFEVLFLTLKKHKISIGKLIRFLKIRQELQGRLVSNDELELWGALIGGQNIKIPKDEKMHFKTNPLMNDVFDQAYENGLGFENEKNLKKKKSKHYNFINSIENRRK
jgi:hypothetical protein